MIKNVILKFGPRGFETKLQIAVGCNNVFVGPNNSGKSLLLREVYHYSKNGPSDGRKILDDLVADVPNKDEALQLLNLIQAPPPDGRLLPEGAIWISVTNPSTSEVMQAEVKTAHLLENLDSLRSFVPTSPGDKPSIWAGVYSVFFGSFSLLLDGRTRFTLTDARPGGDLQKAPQNHFAALFKNDAARVKIRDYTKEAFGLYFTLDPTNLGVLRIRMSERPPDDNAEEQGLDARARAYQAAAMDIAELSDGIKAFTGIVSTVISSDYRNILIDEPEAFLHPPLARKLGDIVTTIASERGGTIFSATHSGEYLMGCIETGKPVNVIRLTHDKGSPSARTLASERLASLMRDPLFRSTGTLNALFHASAIVCEADADRAFYQEINRRLQHAGRQSAKDAIFLNAQNKSTVRRIVGPLRELGIPAAAIVDIDILKRGDLTDLLNSCFVPEAVVHGLAVQRGDLRARFEGLGLDMKKGGVGLLSGKDREALETFFASLANYGVFAVPFGELESWLGALGITGEKKDWLPSVFDAMRGDPDDAAYLRPSEGDVWSFMESLASWLDNRNRLGMP